MKTTAAQEMKKMCMRLKEKEKGKRIEGKPEEQVEREREGEKMMNGHGGMKKWKRQSRKAMNNCFKKEEEQKTQRKEF